jgi:hypothetical protein
MRGKVSAETGIFDGIVRSELTAVKGPASRKGQRLNLLLEFNRDPGRSTFGARCTRRAACLTPIFFAEEIPGNGTSGSAPVTAVGVLRARR